MDNEKEIHVLKNGIQYVKKLAGRLEDSVTTIYKVENFLDKYMPLYVQSQISEFLYTLTSSSMKKKLSEFEEKYISQYNKMILCDDGKGDISKKIKDAHEVLDKIIKRNKKYNPNKYDFVSTPINLGKQQPRKSTITQDSLQSQQQL